MKYFAPIIIFSLFFINVTLANNWTGSSYTSTLKKSAEINEKSNSTAAIEQYLELANYYQLLNEDSVKYFLAKSLSVALLSNDNDLQVIAWIKHNEYLDKDGNSNALANAKQLITAKSNVLLKCLIEIFEQRNNLSKALLDKTDKFLLAAEKDIERGNETDKLIFLLLQEERANAGFGMNSSYQYPSDIAIGLKIAKAKGYMNAYMTLLVSKAMMLSANANYSEAFKLNYEYKEQAKKLDNIVYYQASLIHLAHAAYESKKYEVVEDECNELINLALSAKHRSKPYSRNKFTEAHNLLFMTYCEQGKYDKALYYIEKCIYYSDSLAKLHYSEDSLMAIDARLNLGALYYELGQHQKAADQFLGLIRKYDTDLDYVTKATLNTNIGECYVSLGQYAKALKYLNLSQTVIQELGVRTMATFYRSKREAFKGLRQYDSAYVYYSLYQMAHDSVYNLEKQQALAEVSEKYDNEKLQTKNNFLEAEAQMNKTKEGLYLLLIGFGIVIVIAGLVVYRNKKVLKEKQESLLITEKENLAIQLQAKEAEEARIMVELELKKAREQEILAKLEFKSRETTSMATVALQNANLLVEIQGIVKGINGNQEENNRIMREVNSLIGNQKHLEAFWETFRRYFQEVHPRFFEILEERHPKLTLNDQKICAYLGLGMSTNEISLLQNIEARSFLRYRQRLKEKLGLETSEEIEAYLNSLV